MESTGRYGILTNGGNEQVYKTSNYGATWSTITLPPFSGMYTGCFCSELVGGTGTPPIIALSTVGAVYISQDFGSSWSSDKSSGINGGGAWSISGTPTGSNIVFAQARTGNGVVLSTNSGTSFSIFSPNPASSGFGKCIKIGMTGSTRYMVYAGYTSDLTQIYNGSSWVTPPSPYRTNASALFTGNGFVYQSAIGMSSSGKLITICNYSTNKLYYSTDYGSTWTDITDSSSYTSDSLYGAVVSRNGKYILVAGSSGYYVRTLLTTN